MALKDILDCVPDGWTPRESQVEIFKQFLVGLEEGKEYFFLSAPTGSGKSLVNMTISKYMGDSYVMTPLKSLQRQYMDDFKSFVVEVKGRSNYQCPNGTRCHKAKCVDEEISPWKYFPSNCGRCPWVEILEAGEASDITLFNFYSYICQTKFANRFTSQRGALIIDEAHNLIETLRNLFDINIRCDSLEARAIDLPVGLRGISELSEWIESQGLEKARTLAALSPEDDDSNRFRDLLFKFESVVGDPENYVLGADENKYNVRRKKVGKFFNSHLSPYGEIKIFSSATLLNPKIICEYLSIPWEKVCYISLPWPMTAEQGPICLDLARSRITYQTLRDPATLDGLAESVSIILDELHPKDRGVIHCVSHSLGERVLSKLSKKSRRRITDNLAEYKQKKKKVLLGPSFYEGLDLKDDLCRFQILLKIPLPSIADPLIKYLTYRHPEVKDRVITSIAQAYGRGIRSNDDFSTFYILDGMIVYWMAGLPEYMRKAVLR